MFSGIGGFALAVDTVWPGTEHIFCDNNKFCQQVLRKWWPNAKIYEDIKDINSDTFCVRETQQERGKPDKRGRIVDGIDLLTGGFPCQPFSCAGQRRGTEDNRFLWPEMFRVIKLTRPHWIVGENVAGINSMVQYENDFNLEDKEYSSYEDARIDCERIIRNGQGRRSGKGILQNILEDLAEIGYEVQAFIIPACAVNAPHRRDRVWIVANKWGSGQLREAQSQNDGENSERGRGLNFANTDSDASDTGTNRPQRKCPRGDSGKSQGHDKGSQVAGRIKPDWNRSWLAVAHETCSRILRVDDGLPVKLDGFKLTKAGHRVERLKALGNAIVPQVAIEIMKAIKETGLF